MSKFVKIRIAVAVDPNEEWGSSGWPTTDENREIKEAAMIDCVLDCVDEGAALYWLEAYLEVPEAKVVLAEVRNG